MNISILTGHWDRGEEGEGKRDDEEQL